MGRRQDGEFRLVRRRRDREGQVAWPIRLIRPFVPEAAAAVGLTIAPADLGDVTQAFAVLARLRRAVAIPLPEETVAAAVFIPDDGAAR